MPFHSAICRAALAAFTLIGAGLELGRAEHTGPQPRNLFAEYLGKTQAEVDARIAADFQQLYYGDAEDERVYYPVGDDMAYIYDLGNGDVRSEGMSYGMMIAVQLDRKEEFDRLWRWAHRYMRHADGPLEGYFAWQCGTDGAKLDPGSASDGEEWFAMALFFAGKRWGDGEGIFDYTAEANALLREMLHKDPQGEERAVSMFDVEHRIIRFVPWIDWDGVSDPSYHLPAFYELWALWAEGDREFWKEAATVSRQHFKEAAHPETGLMPDYSYYKPSTRAIGDHKDFRFDAWRVMSNVALDHHWWGKDPEWQVAQSNRILAFLSCHLPNIPNQFSVDGEPLSKDSSAGLYAMAATAALAADRALGEPFVKSLWEQPAPTGKWRYYDGMLHLLALLQVGGRFDSFERIER